MPTYKFPQFKAEIINPTVTVLTNSIVIRPNLMQIEVDVVLTTPNGSKFGIHLEEVSVNNLEFQGYDNLLQTVMVKLAENETTSI